MPDADFDDCGKKGIKDLAEANIAGAMVGSMAHGHANRASVNAPGPMLAAIRHLGVRMLTRPI